MGVKQSGLGANAAVLYRALPPNLRRRLALLILLMLAGAVAELVTIAAVVPFLALLSSGGAGQLGWIGETMAAIGLSSLLGNVRAAAGLLAAAAVIATALRLMLARVSQDFVYDVVHHLSVDIQRRTILQPYEWHVAHSSSEALSYLQQVELLGWILLQLVQSITAAVIGAAILLLLVAIDPVTTVIAALAFAAIYVLISAFAKRRLQANSEVLGSAYEQRIKIVREGLGSIRDLIIDSSQASVIESFRRVDRGLTDAQANSAFIGAAPRFAIDGAAIIVIAVLAIVVSGREGGLIAAIPILGAFALAAQRLLPFVQQLYRAWTGLAGTSATIVQVADRVRLPIPRTEKQAAAPLPFSRVIELRGVGFTYRGRNDPAVSDVSFVIPNGCRFGLTGRTGSGKSTIADLLMGLIDPDSGEILVDGRPLTAENRRAWQRNVAHVPQSPFLLDSTIARNIALSDPGASIDVARVRAAAKLAQLDEFVATLPLAYEAHVGEGGISMSGGQRQRLALARAIYKQAPLLVLDEATSALDPETEAGVLKTMGLLQERGSTIFVIAHRGSILDSCDTVVRLENGRVADRDVRNESYRAAQ